MRSGLRRRSARLKLGTDRGNFEGADRVPGAPDYPRFVGDSNLGIVRGIGAGVTRFEVGDRVVATQPHQSEYVISQFGDIFKIPPDVDDEDGCVCTPLRAQRTLLPQSIIQGPGENVAVVGLGVLGLGGSRFRSSVWRPRRWAWK